MYSLVFISFDSKLFVQAAAVSMAFFADRLSDEEDEAGEAVDARNPVAAILQDEAGAARQPRTFLTRLTPENVTNAHTLRYYRFPRGDLNDLVEELRGRLERGTRRSHAIPVCTQVLATLRFYASGSFQSVIGDVTGLSQSSVSRIINNVTTCLVELARQEIKMPSTVVQRNAATEGFARIAGFPSCIGAIDCTHVPIKAPVENEPLFVNRKNFHSMNVQCVCNADQMFTSFYANYPGATHDSHIWNTSALKIRFERGDFADSLLLGEETDSAIILKINSG